MDLRRHLNAVLHHPATAWVVLLLSFALTGLAWHLSDSAIRAKALQRFGYQTDDIAYAISKRLLAYATALRGGTGFFNASERVSRDAWRQYVSDLRLQENFPGIQGLGFSLMISPEALGRHLADIRSEGFPDYRIRPEGARSLYSSIVFLEPFDWRNQRAFGFDMYSEPVRRAAMERARDSGEPAISGRVTLVQETTEDVQYGFLMYIPVYRRGAPVATPDERRAALTGFVYSPFRAADFMAGVLGADQGGIRLDLYDGDAVTPDALLYHSDPGHAAAVPTVRPADRFAVLLRLPAFQRTWTLSIQAGPGYLSGVEAAQPLIVAIGGVVIDLFLFIIIDSIGRQKREAEIQSRRLAADLADSEARYGALFESAKAAMLILDPESGAILDANPAALAFYGYDLQQMRAMRIFDINTLSPDEIRERMCGASDGSETAFIFSHRRSNGDVRLVEVHSGPFRYEGRQALYSIIHDVTERQRIEAALVASERRYGYVLSATGEGIWDWDIPANRVSHNPRWNEILGLEDVHTEHSVEAFAALLHEEDREAVMRMIAAALEGRAPYVHQHRMRRGDGRVIWVLDRGQVVERDATGAPRRMVGSLIDLTDRVEQELALETERRRLQNVIDGTRAGTWEWNLQTGDTVFNERWAEMAGYRLDELAPTSIATWNRLVHPDDLERSSALVTQHLSGGIPYYECEVRMRHRDGHWIWVLDRGKVASWSPDGSPLLMSGTHQDITARKEAEEQARETELLLRSSIETIREGFVIYDPDDRLSYCNEEYRDLYRLSAPVIAPGRTFEEIIRYGAERGQYQDAVGREEEWIAERLAAHRSCHRELVQKLDDGRWLKVREQRTPTGYTVGFRVDVTEVFQAKEAAEAANVAKSRFLATMSHEIRTPMNGILGMAQLLLAPTLPDGKRLDYARTILTSGQALLKLLNDILDYSKVEAGKLQLEKTTFDPDQLMRDTQALFAESARTKGLELTFQWAGEKGQYYRADAHRLRQMLANLVGNAIKFTPEGAVCIDADEVSRDETGAQLEFAVSDTGIGIARDKLALLFKPFSQTDSSTTRQYGGSGLGLSIVRDIARLMGGDAGVDSTLGQGSRFWFRVRAEVAAAGEERRSQERPLPNGRSLAIVQQFLGEVLVAEDNRASRSIIKALLTRFGLTVRLEGDGQACVDRILGGEVPDLLLLDCETPVLDGYAVSERIRQWEAANARPRLPIVAITADAFQENRERCESAGMDEVLTKPILLSALREVLERWLPKTADDLSEPLSPAVPEQAVDRSRVFPLVDEILPLLHQSKFDAVSRFKALQSAVEGTRMAADIDDVGELLTMFDFERALERLRRTAEAEGWREMT